MALFAGVQSPAQTATNVPGVFPNTNIVQSLIIGFAQGTCNDGTNLFVDLTTGIECSDITNGTKLKWWITPSGGLTNGLTDFFPNIHLGDPDYYQGYIYVPLESAVGVPQGAAIIDVAIFNTANRIRYAAVSISNYQSEASAVCIDPVLSNSVALFATNFKSASTNDGIYEYSLNNLTNLTFVKALPMSQNIKDIQGIVCVGGMLYVLGDNGRAGEVYQVNPTNGTVVHLVQLNITNEAEWEGLDSNRGFLLANEGWTGTLNWFDFFGVLTFSSTHWITGSVKDVQNNPIVGVGVSAAATINGTNQTVTVDTDTNGNYSLNVTNGSWNIALNCSDGTDSLGYLGNYSCPNIQNVNLITNDATANFTVQICSVSITTPAPLPPGEIGVSYSQTLQAASCYPGYTWTMINGSLPSGFSLSSDGVLSGTPSGSGGAFNFTAQVTDANNFTTNQTFSLVINNAVRIATTSLPVGASFDIPLSASNGQPPYIWSLSPGSPQLPGNFSLTTNGMLLGAATTPGTFNFTVRVKDVLAGIADQTLTVTLLQPLAVSAAGGQITVQWPDWSTNYVLQTATNLASPDWITVSDAVPGTAYIVTNIVPLQLFRLH